MHFQSCLNSHYINIKFTSKIKQADHHLVIYASISSSAMKNTSGEKKTPSQKPAVCYILDLLTQLSVHVFQTQVIAEADKWSQDSQNPNRLLNLIAGVW